MHFLSFLFSNFIISNLFYNNFLKNKLNKNIKINFNKINNNFSSLNLLIGFDNNHNNIYIPENGLYQNFLITGTIGSGKTSSAMYPFTKQFLKYNSINKHNKLGMLILDVKGNYYKQVSKFAEDLNIKNDVITIELGSSVTYNPLHNPNLKPQIIANRLKTILTLFSENNSESYWLDKAEQVITHAIVLCRLYNNGYVTFYEIHKLITTESYYKEKITILRNLFINSKFSIKNVYDLNSALDFFEKEFFCLDDRTLSILKSEITRITGTFISDYDVLQTFCPNLENLTFSGFHEILEKGKILILNLNISEYKNLAKIVAAYLKLDFQTEVMNNLANNCVKPSVFICDEYAEFVTKNDSDFFSLSREAKCINIVSTQSYSSLKNSLKDDSSVKVIVQNLINKIWFRTDDIFTIEEAQKQLGKEDKIKTSSTISENAKETRFSYISHSLNSSNSNISESYNTYTQTDFIFDTNFFSQNLETFTALTFLSDGNKILKPCKLNMFPYFKNNF